MEYYSATKKNEIMLFVATWMDLEIVKLREVSKRRRMSYDILSMQNIKRNDISEPNYKTETDSDLENRLMVAKREEIVRESGIDMYTLLYFKWITTKALLYSTGNSAQCHVPGCMGREVGGEWILVYV